MEDLYGRIPYMYLQLTRINRTVPLYSGSDNQGNPMANWAMDSLPSKTRKIRAFQGVRGNRVLLRNISSFPR